MNTRKCENKEPVLLLGILAFPDLGNIVANQDKGRQCEPQKWFGLYLKGHFVGCLAKHVVVKTDSFYELESSAFQKCTIKPR